MTEKDDNQVISFFKKERHLLSLVDILFRNENEELYQIFSSIEELIDGKLVCGAGGGGFLQVILKKGVTKQQVENRLNEVFMDSLVGVADCKLVWK